MKWWILYLILAVVIGAIVAGYFFLKKKMEEKISLQKDLVDQHKVTTQILVLEKRMDKVDNANIPKNVVAQIPKIYKIKKVPIVKAKIGPQVMDLLCDEEVFEKIPEKKTINVELAGIFIAGIKSAKAKGKK
ncbi:MAG TPA: hypothetical protein PKX79_13260 [Spirochaetota bacterium]|nr:MAG: hypothetical protein BWY23_02066 [Spirochaetes bacterium ADurb.Bin218]HOK03467.1 hypothetical protein [Spirochaetota bacterium]HOK93799.1 hypothetical protein [Spirochaetota bacterium]HON15969.1 hypothetical protein [Spirochaetota bacterium]HOQ12611.1 hypothetical protein [Spirochaetota bacterium]